MRNTCLNKVHDLAQRDPRVVFIGSDLSPGLLKEMRAEMPDRWYMEGVTEANVVGMAAGMAMEGYVPYVNTIATFITRRCYEQVAVDLCIHDLPVRLIGNGGGLVYAPLGPTHLAVEDIAIMRALPNMTVVAVSDAEEMKAFMDVSVDWPHPIYIRLGKGGDPVIYRPEQGFAIGRAVPMRVAKGRHRVALMSTGVLTGHCLEAAEALERDRIDASVLHIPTIKPLDEAAVLEQADGARLVVTVEEGIANGGLGSAITDLLVRDLGRSLPPVLRIALPDAFPKHYGSQADHFSINGMMPDQIAASVVERLDELQEVA